MASSTKEKKKEKKKELKDKTCKSVEWFTPPRILDPVRKYFGGRIFLDPCTTPLNPAQAEYIFTKDNCGLKAHWHTATRLGTNATYVNPPYGEIIQQWAAKIRHEAEKDVHIVALLPGQRFETIYWQREILNDRLDAICFVKGRVFFLDADGNERKSNPYGSMLYLFNGSVKRFVQHVGHLGKVISFNEIKHLPPVEEVKR